jgi:hypothetical protein
MSKNNAMAGAEEPDDGRCRLHGIFELLLRCSFLPAPDQGIPAYGNQDQF